MQTDAKMTLSQLDELDQKMAELDFSHAKPASQIPALAKRQAQNQAQWPTRQLLDDDVLALMSEKAENPAEIAKINNVLRALLA